VSLVEKLCYRFRTTQDVAQWRNFAHCLTLLPYNDKCVKKLQSQLACFQATLSDEEVYDCFVVIISKARKFASVDMKKRLLRFTPRPQRTTLRSRRHQRHRKRWQRQRRRRGQRQHEVGGLDECPLCTTTLRTPRTLLLPTSSRHKRLYKARSELPADRLCRTPKMTTSCCRRTSPSQSTNITTSTTQFIGCLIISLYSMSVF
jgi:hypothetical protein